MHARAGSRQARSALFRVRPSAIQRGAALRLPVRSRWTHDRVTRRSNQARRRIADPAVGAPVPGTLDSPERPRNAWSTPSGWTRSELPTHWSCCSIGASQWRPTSA